MQNATNYPENFTRSVLIPIAQKCFKTEIKGDLSFLDHYKKRPIIVVGNHAGAGLSWDNILFDATVFHRTEILFGKGIKMRRLVHQSLYENKVKPFQLKNWFVKMQCLPASMEHLDLLCEQKEMIYISPEGYAGMVKGHSKKNQVQKFSSSFVYTAKKHNAIIVLNAVINSEYLIPYPIFSTTFNKWLKRKFHIPFLPLNPLTLLAVMPRYYISCLPIKLEYHLIKTVETTTLGINIIEQNRIEAEDMRKTIENHIQKQDRGFWRALLLRNLVKNPFDKKHITPSDFYRMFWEFELDRKLTTTEKIKFTIPIWGHYWVKKNLQQNSWNNNP